MKTLKGIAITLILFSLMFTMASAATEELTVTLTNLPSASDVNTPTDGNYITIGKGNTLQATISDHTATGTLHSVTIRVDSSVATGFQFGSIDADAMDDSFATYNCPQSWTDIATSGTTKTWVCIGVDTWSKVDSLIIEVKNNGKTIKNADVDYIRVSVNYTPTGILSVVLNKPITNKDILVDDTFLLNGTVTCQGPVGANCGTVQLRARYGAATPDTLIPASGSLQIPDINPAACGAMTQGNTCSGQWTVKATQAGTYYVDVQATSDLAASNDTLNRKVDVGAVVPPGPVLTVTITNPTASASFLVGSNITVQAQVLSNSTPVSTATVTMSGACTGAMSYTGSNGVYNASCELATTGNKTVTITAQNDTRQDQESVNFGVHDTQELRLQISQPVQNTLFERGECADLIVQVFIGSTVTTNAFVKGNTSTGLVFDLMAGIGNYTAKYCFGSTDPSPFKFEFTATEEIDGQDQSVTGEVTVKLKSVHLDISLLTQGPFYVGNLVKPKIEVKHEDGTAVTGASVSGEVQGKGIEFQEIGSGVYESITPYYVSVSDEIAGQLTISLEAIDAQQNTGELGESLQIAESNIAYKIEELGSGSTLFCFNQPKTFTFEVTDLADNTKDDVNVMGFYHNDFYPGTFVGNGTYEVEFQMPPTAQSEIGFVAFKNGERSEELSFEFNLTDQLSLAYPGEFQENGTLWSENQSIEIMVIYPDGTPVESGTFRVEIGEENNTRTFEMIYTNGTWVTNLNLTNITYGTQTLHFAGQDELGNNLDIEVEFTFSAGGPIDIFLMLIVILIVACIAIFIGLFSRLYGTAQRRLSKNLSELNKEEKRVEQEERNTRYSFYKRVINSVTLKEKLLGYNKEKAAIEAKKAALKKKYTPKTELKQKK